SLSTRAPSMSQRPAAGKASAEFVMVPAYSGTMSFLPSGSGALVFIAFEGQDADASEAASSLVKDLIEVWQLNDSEILDTDGFYEFRFSEPEIVRDDDGTASIAWPGLAAHRGRLGELPITVVHGHEPGLKWREFLSLVLAQLGPEDSVVLLGGLHAEVPHTRPLPVVANTEDRELAVELDIDANAYEGPIGI